MLWVIYMAKYICANDEDSKVILAKLNETWYCRDFSRAILGLHGVNKLPSPSTMLKLIVICFSFI